ncbi:MAG: methyltransferase [Roseburia sp.]|nr:methyltransferase [Roseburia sp.]
MVKELFEILTGDGNQREALSKLRGLIKEEAAHKELKELAGKGEAVIALLQHEDAKIRKNAALLLGDLQLQNALPALKEAYEKETTLFVKSSYLTALSKLDVTELLDFFKARKAELLSSEVAEEEKKHIGEELHELTSMITAVEGINKHTFTGFSKPHMLLLSTNREQREVTLEEVAELSATVQRRAELHPLGVQVFTKELAPFTKLRSYRELLFPIALNEPVSGQPKEAANQLWNSGILEFLQECHKGEAPFYFRIEIKSAEPQTEYAKKLAMALEQCSGYSLVNDTKDYEVEIRLLASKEGGYAAFLKLKSIPMKRFAYRKNAIAMSIHPATAAMMMRLAKPYLKEQAQILDPCCGVGTILIERDICVPAREMYGIDIFGDAITGARENASLAGEKINFIHRDFMDFKHEYLFDEIITNMPVKGKKTKEEMDAFFGAFFKKAASLLNDDGKIIMYTNEAGFVKKQLRLQTNYRLVQEFCIRKKEQFFLYIIEKR